MSLAALISGCVFASLEEVPRSDPPEDDLGEIDAGPDDSADVGPNEPLGCTAIDLDVDVAAGSTPRLSSMGSMAIFGAWSGSDLTIRVLGGESIGTVQGPEININSSGDRFDILGQPQDGGESIDLVVAAIEGTDLMLYHCTDSNRSDCASTKPNPEDEFGPTVKLLGMPNENKFYLGATRKVLTKTVPTVFRYALGYIPNPDPQPVLFQKVNTPDDEFGTRKVRIAPLGDGDWNLAAVTNRDEYAVFSGSRGVDRTLCGIGKTAPKVIPMSGKEKFFTAQVRPDGTDIDLCDRVSPTEPRSVSPLLADYRDFDVAQGSESTVVVWVDGDIVQARKYSAEGVGPVWNIAEGVEITNVTAALSQDDSTLWIVVVDGERAYLHEFALSDIGDCF